MKRSSHTISLLPRELTALAIRELWQKRLGPRYNRRNRILCRFYPSCSQYAVLAVTKHGVLKGSLLAYDRVKRCTTHNYGSTVDIP